MAEVKKEFNDFFCPWKQSWKNRSGNMKIRWKPRSALHGPGNYIDYAAVKDISKDKLLELFEEQEQAGLEKNEYESFLKDMEKAS